MPYETLLAYLKKYPAEALALSEEEVKTLCALARIFVKPIWPIEQKAERLEILTYITQLLINNNYHNEETISWLKVIYELRGNSVGNIKPDFISSQLIHYQGINKDWPQEPDFEKFLKSYDQILFALDGYHNSLSDQHTEQSLFELSKLEARFLSSRASPYLASSIQKLPTEELNKLLTSIESLGFLLLNVGCNAELIRFYQALLEETTKRSEGAHYFECLLEKLVTTLTANRVFDYRETIWSKSRLKLGMIRDSLTDTITSETLIDYNADLKFFIRGLLDETTDQLGLAPVHYCVLALGSLARNMALPYSDLECGLLIKYPEDEPSWESKSKENYLRVLWEIFEFKIRSLGETNIGLQLDSACQPRTEGAVIVTPTFLVHRFTSTEIISSDGLVYSLLHAEALYGDIALFEDYQKKLQELYFTVCNREPVGTAHARSFLEKPEALIRWHRHWAIAQFKRNEETYQKHLINKTEKCDLKKPYVKLLTFLPLDIALYHGAHVTNVPEALKLITQNHWLPQEVVNEIEEALNELQCIRAHRHQLNQKQDDDIDAQDEELVGLLEKIENNLLNPCYEALTVLYEKGYSAFQQAFWLNRLIITLKKNEESSGSMKNQVGKKNEESSGSMKNQVGNRKGLDYPNDQLLPLLRLSDAFSVGKAVDDGGCFFDGLAQALNSITGKNEHTEKSLRLLCHQYYSQNKEVVQKWNTKDYGGIEQGDDYYFIQYTKSELDKNFNGRAPIWGRSYIEGIILCRQLRLEAVYVIELMNDPENKKRLIPNGLKITEEKVQSIDLDQQPIDFSSHPCLVVSQSGLHFVPVLPKTKMFNDADNPFDSSWNQSSGQSCCQIQLLEPGFEKTYQLKTDSAWVKKIFNGVNIHTTTPGRNSATFDLGKYWLKIIEPDKPAFDEQANTLKVFIAREYAVTRLAQLLGFSVIPEGCAVKLSISKENETVVYYGWLARKIDGRELNNAFEQKPEDAKAIDPLCYGQLSLLSLLVCPEDWQPRNFIVTGKDINGYSKLYSVDNKRVFIEPIAQLTFGFLWETFKLRLKNCLYLLPQLKEPFSKELHEHCARIDIQRLTEHWLFSLESLDNLLDNEFGNVQNPSGFKHLSLEKFLVYALRLKFEQIITIAKSEMSHELLLKNIEPNVAKLYEDIRKKGNNFYLAFNQSYRSNIHHQMFSQTTRLLLEEAKISAISLGRSLLALYPLFVNSILWKELTNKAQKYFILILQTQSHESLNLRGCRILKNEDLRVFITNSPHLKELDVSECPFLTNTIFSILSQAKQLTVLKCESNLIGDIKWCANLPKLKIASFKHCRNIRKIDISNASGLHIDTGGTSAIIIRAGEPMELHKHEILKWSPPKTPPKKDPSPPPPPPEEKFVFKEDEKRMELHKNALKELRKISY